MESVDVSFYLNGGLYEIKNKWITTDDEFETLLIRNQYVSKKSLKESRKWTEGIIKQYLGEPDVKEINPYHKSTTMCLYDIDRVISTEKQIDFQRHMERIQSTRDKLSDAVNCRIRDKRAELLRYVESLPIIIPKLSNKELYRKASNNHREHRRSLYDDDTTIDYDNTTSDFEERITVNYLRHRFNKYEKELDKISGTIGVNTAYIYLNLRVYKAIGDQYPYLQEECERQYNEKVERVNFIDPRFIPSDYILSFEDNNSKTCGEI